jgi:deoxyribonuclease-1
MTSDVLRLFFLILLFISSSISAHPHKKLSQLLFQMHESYRYTLFCQQPFLPSGTLILPECKSCPSTPLHIQWMPVVPLKALAAPLSCYQEKRCVDKKGKSYGGLRCCQKMDPHFINMTKDLRNYVPENPLLVKLRKNYPFDNAFNTSSTGGCHFYVDQQNKHVSPSPLSRGLIARTYLYFHHRYNLPLSQEEKNLYFKWLEEHPPSEWELKREQFIYEQQGDRNPYAFRNR